MFRSYAHAARYDIGEYPPKDHQGGRFIQTALIGSETDADVADAIRGGLRERTYGDPIGWRRFEEWAISRLLQDHADILLAGFGRQPLNEFNHQSHGALAMLYLGTLFPRPGGAASLRQRAVTILTHHLERAFVADGGNVERMFGYYPFEAHIFRDAYLLRVHNGVEPPAGILPALKRMAAFLAAVAQRGHASPRPPPPDPSPAG